MKFRNNWFDIAYHAQFNRILFEFAAAPIKALAAIQKVLPATYGVTSANLSVVAANVVSDVHAKVALFNGNASLDITADALSAQFNNPAGKDDGAIIQRCIHSSLEALAEVAGRFEIKEEAVTLRMFAELIDNPDANSFLRLIAGKHQLYEVVGGDGTQIVPGLQFELINDPDRWSSNWSVARSIRSPKEVFISTTTRFLIGCKFANLGEKANHMMKLLDDFLKKTGLQAEKKPNAS